jgi:hypothetical protein
VLSQTALHIQAAATAAKRKWDNDDNDKETLGYAVKRVFVVGISSVKSNFGALFRGWRKQ